MKRIINFVGNYRSEISTYFYIMILDVLTVFLIGGLTVDLSPSYYIFFVVTILLIITTGLLLSNIKLAGWLLIIIFPFENISFIIKKSPYKFDSLMFTPLDIFIVSATFCLFLYKSTFKSRTNVIKMQINPGYLSLFALILFGASSIMWSPHIILSVYHILRLILNSCIFILIVVLLKSEKDIIRAIKTLIAITMITALGMLISTLPLGNISKGYTLANGFIMEFSFNTYQTRASCFLPNKSGVLLLNIGILFSIGLLSQSDDKKEKFLLLLIIPLLIFTAFHTMARVPIISLFITIVFLLFAIKYFRTYFFRNLSIFAFCFMLLFSIFTVTHSYIINFVRSYYPYEAIQSEHSLNDRLVIWGKAINAIENNNAYIYGLGAGGGTYYEDPEVHVHNILLSIFIDFGIIGLILFLILISISVKMIYVALLNVKEGFDKAILLSALGCILTLCIASLVDYDYNLNILWLVIGITTAIYRHAVSNTNSGYCVLNYSSRAAR